MKVYFSYHAFLMQSYGGVTRYYAELLRELVTQGVNCEVIAPFHINDYLGKIEGARVRGTRVPKPPKSGPVLRFANDLASRWALPAGPAIYHESYFSGFELARSGQRRVTTVHDCIHELRPEDFASTDSGFAMKRQSIQRADHIFCVSNNTKKDLQRLYGVADAQVTVTPLAVRVPEFDRAKRHFDTPYFLYVGPRDRYKNAAVLFEAFAESNARRDGARLVFFGGGAFSAEENAAFKRLDIEPQVVQVAGADAKLFELYAKAEAFVFPSYYEGFGLPTLEAMSVGCPVICSDTSSFPEVAGEAGLYFPPAESAVLKTHLDAVFANPARRAELERKGVENCRRFSWTHTAELSRNAYAQLL